MKKFILGIGVLCLLFPALVRAHERLAVLPFQSLGVEASDEDTTHRLPLREIARLNKYEIVLAGEVRNELGDAACSEKACAIAIGKQLNAARVVFGSLNRLAEKIIVQYTMVKISSGQVVLSEDASALRVEDLDTVIKRVAASIVQQIPFAKTSEVGMVTSDESQELQTRQAPFKGGVTFGYLYPENGYDNKDRVFALDFEGMYEAPNFAVTGLLGIRDGVAMNVGGMYLFSRRDFSPYVGGGLGFHWVLHEEFDEFGNSVYKAKRRDGFEMMLSGGLLAVRTYNFRVLLNLDYCVTVNGYNDRALVLTLGIMGNGKISFEKVFDGLVEVVGESYEH